MASCKTTQWDTEAPYVKLTVIKKTSTDSSVTLLYRFEYISETAIVSDSLKTFTISMANSVIAKGTFDLNEKTGLNLIAAGTVTVPITTSTNEILFKVAFAFKLQKSDGTFIDTLEASSSIPVASTIAYTSCGIPSALSITDNGDNTATISCIVGSNGINNTAEGVDLYITCDGTVPSTSNYKYRYTLYGTAGESVIKTVSFKELSESTVARIFGNSCAGIIRAMAKTIGDAGVVYSSAISEKSTAFTWYGSTVAPEVITPSMSDVAGMLINYTVTWKPGYGGINNDISKYLVSVYSVTTKKLIATYYTTDLRYDIPASNFTAGHIYRFCLTTVGTISGFDGTASESAPVTIKAIDRFPAPTLVVSDGGTVASLEYLTNKTYINIDSGNILKLSWNTPTASNNSVNSYQVFILKYNPEAGYEPLYSTNVGNVNEFYLRSSVLKNISQSFISLKIYIKALSNFGAAYEGISNVEFVDISKGCGMYTTVDNSDKQPIMKRSLAFTKVDFALLKDIGGAAITDAVGNPLFGKSSSVQDAVSGWTLMQEFLLKDTEKTLVTADGTMLLDINSAKIRATGNNGAWLTSDISYEVLTDIAGEIITDINYENIFVL